MRDGIPDMDVDDLFESADRFDFSDRDGDSAPLGVHIVNWRDQDDDLAADAWDSLRSWVEWFLFRYDVPPTLIPDCWFRHGALVEELSALHVAHVAAFDPADTGFGPISWHERFTLARDRFKAAYKNGCLNGHVDPRPRVWQVDAQEWAAWCTSTHAHPQQGELA